MRRLRDLLLFNLALAIVLIAPVYVYFIMIGSILGCAAMRAACSKRTDFLQIARSEQA